MLLGLVSVKPARPPGNSAHPTSHGATIAGLEGLLKDDAPHRRCAAARRAVLDQPLQPSTLMPSRDLRWDPALGRVVGGLSGTSVPGAQDSLSFLGFLLVYKCTTARTVWTRRAVAPYPLWKGAEFQFCRFKAAAFLSQGIRAAAFPMFPRPERRSASRPGLPSLLRIIFASCFTSRKKP